MEGLFEGCRKLRGRQFRKRLGCFNYKVKGEQKMHKKPGVVPLVVREQLLKQRTHEANTELKNLEKKSIYPFGSWNKFGVFTRSFSF